VKERVQLSNEFGFSFVVVNSTTWILNLYIEPLRNSTNQLYYSKGYRTTEIEGYFA
jgi:hypothetical protein